MALHGNRPRCLARHHFPVPAGNVNGLPVGLEKIFEQPAPPGETKFFKYESERSDAPVMVDPVTEFGAGGASTFADAAFECANCRATFDSREILSKHAKACGEVVSVVEAIAAGATIIEVEADRQAVLDEVDRLEDLKPELGTRDEKKLFKLKLALDAFKKLKRDTKELVRERKEKPAIGFEPPVDPESLKQPADDDLGF